MHDLAFRPLARADFGLVAAWLAEPLVRLWWHQGHSPEALEREYGPVVDGREPSEVALAVLDERPFGLIQRYTWAAYPKYMAEIAPVWAVPPGALSVDYLVGEPALRGRGLAARMIAAYVEEAWSRYPDARDVVVPVHTENLASWRSLEQAGFVRVASGELEPDNPAHSRDHVVYRLSRPARAPGGR